MTAEPLGEAVTARAVPDGAEADAVFWCLEALGGEVGDEVAFGQGQGARPDDRGAQPAGDGGRRRGPGSGLSGPCLTSGRYEPLVKDEAQVGVHPSSVSQLRGALAAAVSMTSTAPRSNGSSGVLVELAVCMT